MASVFLVVTIAVILFAILILGDCLSRVKKR